ncbi:cupin domain-containing protein [Pseudoteredinibacter isoporae]|uniref:cupin domain-containing protein n=1 Tax=Pseudoteredinibacter isoporae TaxID=570281 RepID=UPI0031036E7B
MKIYPTRNISTDSLDIAELFTLCGKQKSHDLQVGVAGFPMALRHPAKGMAAHEQDEISIILEGEFTLETEEGVFTCKAGDVTYIPAGEAHASSSSTGGKVFYVLFGPGA